MFKINKIYSLVPYCKNFLSELRIFVEQCLGQKKIVIISEKGISSLPVSFKFQVALVSCAVCCMLWVSYSSGKYFAHEDLMLEKDRELWSTNVTKENLQYQVADLHKNLSELNHYFENIKNFDQLANKDIFDENLESHKKHKKIGVANNKNKSDNKENGKVKGILSNIREKVLERISSLESIIEMTGLNVEKVASNNKDLRSTILSKESPSHQGGPYNPATTFDSSDFESEMSYLTQLEKAVHSFPLSIPMKRYWISSNYGRRIDPLRSRFAMHEGVDLVGKHEAKIHSSAPGVVKKARRYGAYGLFVEIKHSSGITTRYGHLNKIHVKEGQKVKRGQLIALQGNTGRSTGEHLHYEVRYNGKAYDPRNFFKAGKHVF